LTSVVDQITGPSPDERKRIRTAIIAAGAAWEGDKILDVWLVEQRMKAERLASQRLARATWALAAVTLALVLATVALVIATSKLV
jgi:hypothetical protein